MGKGRKKKLNTMKRGRHAAREKKKKLTITRAVVRQDYVGKKKKSLISKIMTVQGDDLHCEESKLHLYIFFFASPGCLKSTIGAAGV